MWLSGMQVRDLHTRKQCGLNDLGPRHRKNTTKWILHTKDGCGMNSSDTE